MRERRAGPATTSEPPQARDSARSYGRRDVGQAASSAAELGAPTRGQLVVGAVRLRTARALAGQLGERALDLAPDAADRDAEHALTALQQVDDLVVGHALVDAGSVAHQRD